MPFIVIIILEAVRKINKLVRYKMFGERENDANWLRKQTTATLIYLEIYKLNQGRLS